MIGGFRSEKLKIFLGGGDPIENCNQGEQGKGLESETRGFQKGFQQVLKIEKHA